MRVQKMPTILHTESSLGWGGQEIRVLQESLGMIKRGYRVLIAAPEQSMIYKRSKGEGIAAFEADLQKKNPISILKTISLINRERPDIVNTHSSSDSWVATIASRLSNARPKVIRTRHLSTPIGRSFLSRLIYDILPDAVITTGEEIRRGMINDNHFDGSKIFSIPTGIDLDRFNPERIRPSIKRTGFSVGMIGVLRSWKGHRYFIEAVPEIVRDIPDAVFYIAGDGPQYENIRNLIHGLSLQDRVFMLGHREDIPEIMASLNVIVHPSYASEGVPQSILQAMAMGKPVVASNAGAIKEVVVDGETGFLIEPRNPAHIADRVRELYKHPELMNRFALAGRRLVKENYSVGKMLDRIESLYERLARNG